MISKMYGNENEPFFINIAFSLKKKVSYVHHRTLKSMCTKSHDDWLNSLRVKE